MMGAKKSTQYVPYAIARDIVRANGINNRNQYWKFKKLHNALYLPYVPNRVYDLEWDGWNAFLNNDNSYEKTLERNRGRTIDWMPYWDAVRWAQVFCKERGIVNKDMWRKMYRECGGNTNGVGGDGLIIPKNIPMRPEVIYSEFEWDIWFNTSVHSGMIAKQMVVKVALVYVVSGVVSFKIVNGDCVEGGYTKAYVMESEDDVLLLRNILNANSNGESYGEWICSNVYQCLYDMDNALLMFK